MKFGLYPGCSFKGTAVEFGQSIEAVCEKLGVELVELDDWICCGASPAHNTSHLLATALPLYNLVRAEREGFEKLFAPCIACSWRLKTAVKEISEDKELKSKAEQVVGESYQGKVKPLNVVEFFTQEVGFEKIKQRVKRPLKELKVVCYYGCMLTRPPEIAEFDVVEDPQSLDNLMAILGAESLGWPSKTDCCGVSFALSRTDIVVKLCHDILKEAKRAGAEAIIVACPLCQTNLDVRQAQVEETYKTKYNIPIIYFTQMIGVAFGLTPKEVGLDKLTINAISLLAQKGLL